MQATTVVEVSHDKVVLERSSVAWQVSLGVTGYGTNEFQVGDAGSGKKFLILAGRPDLL